MAAKPHTTPPLGTPSLTQVHKKAAIAAARNDTDPAPLPVATVDVARSPAIMHVSVASSATGDSARTPSASLCLAVAAASVEADAHPDDTEAILEHLQAEELAREEEQSQLACGEEDMEEEARTDDSINDEYDAMVEADGVSDSSCDCGRAPVDQGIRM